MKIILRENVDALGLEGDTVEVAVGYARNYLIPKGLALEATTQNIKLIETQRKKIEVRRIKAKEDAEQVREKIAEVEVTISQKAGEEEKLYGSVTSMDIAGELEPDGPGPEFNDDVGAGPARAVHYGCGYVGVFRVERVRGA